MQESNWVDKKIESPLSAANKITNGIIYFLIIFCLVAFVFLVSRTNIAYLFIIVIFFLIFLIIAEHTFYRNQRPIQIINNNIILTDSEKETNINISDIDEIKTGKLHKVLSIMWFLNILFNSNALLFSNQAYHEISKRKLFYIKTKNNSYSLLINDVDGFQAELSKNGINITTTDTKP